MTRLRATFALPLALATLTTAHAAVVEQAYSATLTHYAARDGAWRVIQGLQLAEGQTVQGVIRYDNALVGTLTQGDGTVYHGARIDNHLTAAIGSAVLWGAPTGTPEGCSPLQITCGLLPSSPVLSDYNTGGAPVVTSPLSFAPAPAPLPRVATLSSDRQALTFQDTRPTTVSTPWLTSFGDVAGMPLSVTSMQLTLAWLAPQPSTALPAELRLGAVQFGSLMVNLSDGSAVFARLDSLAAPVPEASTVWTFSIGLLALAGLQRARRPH